MQSQKSGSKCSRKASLCSSPAYHPAPSGKITAPLYVAIKFPCLAAVALSKSKDKVQLWHELHSCLVSVWQLWLDLRPRLLCSKQIFQQQWSLRAQRYRRSAVTGKPQPTRCLLPDNIAWTCPRIRQTGGPGRSIALETGVSSAQQPRQQKPPWWRQADDEIKRKPWYRPIALQMQLFSFLMILFLLQY